MLKHLITILLLTISTSLMAQILPVPKVVDKLLFNFDLQKHANSLIADLSKVKQLHLISKGKGKAPAYIFTFSESPVKGLDIKSGVVEITSVKSVSNVTSFTLKWSLFFKRKVDKNNFFQNLSDLFDPKITQMKTVIEEDTYFGTQFTDVTPKKGIKTILFLTPIRPEKDSFIVFFTLNVKSR